MNLLTGTLRRSALSSRLTSPRLTTRSVPLRPHAFTLPRLGSSSIRLASTSSTPPPTDSVDATLKPRPKASTPLRRSASASASRPIRANPTPTRSAIRPVLTFAMAERFLLPRIRAHIMTHNASAGIEVHLVHEALWIPRWPASSLAGDATDGQAKKEGEGGEVFIFANGTFVCWGMSEEEAQRFSREVMAPAMRGAALAPLREAETEELEFVTDPHEPTRLQGDLIILGRVQPLDSPEQSDPFLSLPSSPSSTATTPSISAHLPADTLLPRYAFSQALSRSTALSALEASLDNFLSSVSQLPDSLERTGKPGISRREIIKKLGVLMRFRQGLNLNRENFFDTPDLYWVEPELEGFFKSMSAALEVKARTNAVNDKITYAAEVQSLLRQLLTETSTHSMELVIIALIAVEVVIALIRDGPELWHMAFGPPEQDVSEGTPQAA
ncbi:hypothetical protein CONPUDRAFT_99345 [Coniophora puteana RWD-64-598 SS2]|uniref:DUF155 domain-containing protein n=1 Tax=Coniophora puteana (strain RWD-64-598) TaxID=741705 RepID=A0A5M3MX96_CONPW|nr:uncharacterized protein CONPUDRAFT_99345 [Coniophora puteana RWD-64-598 SS2]EIW83779.1 hypothetical protein CONPUDRAFT_99345 [Coniophora puteana RWD-64-598 SS2]